MARRVRTPWCRVDLNTCSQRRVVAAGPLAGPVYIHLTLALFDASDSPRGTLAAWDVDAATIAREWGAPDMVDAIGAAVDGLRDVGLIVTDGDGWTIPGWEDRLPDSRDRKTTANQRKRGKSPDETVASRNIQEHPGTSRNIQEHPATGRDGTGHTYDARLSPGSLPARASAPAPVREAAPVLPLGLAPVGDVAAGDAPTYQALEAKALACKPPGTRRGALALSSTANEQLRRLVSRHGVKACWDGLDRCGDAERPVAMLERVLSGPRKIGRSGAPPAGAGLNTHYGR